MRVLKIIFFLCVFIFITACNDDDEISNGNITLNFTHNWDGENITSSSFNSLNLINANGEQLSIERLRYLISNINLVQSNGVNIPLKNYLMIDVTNDITSIKLLDIPLGTFSDMVFTFGFNDADNIDGAYSDLNSVSWNVPSMLGGGYHFMQFDGKYVGANLSPAPFNFHAIRAVDRTDSNNLIFQDTSFTVSLGEIKISNESTVEIKMNIAEWFKNPITWNLNTLNVSLMPNYDAQIMMNQNGKSIFSLGEVTQ